MRHCPLLLLVLVGCRAATPAPGIEEVMLEGRGSFFYLERAAPRGPRHALPVGLFDSGTGGLTVLEAVVTLDAFNNDTHAEGADGRPDFAREELVYLGDQANMPYGVYDKQGRLALLQEHILKDAQFLLGTRYYPTADAAEPATDKRPVKVIVIACNTATAYGQQIIERVIRRAGLKVAVIGVIGAGARAALGTLPAGASSVGVLATAGTVASGGYVRALQREAAARGRRLRVFQQAGVGLAGAIDGAAEHIQPKGRRPRPGYRGPALNPELLRRYGLDWSEGRMLFEGTPERPRSAQLNAVENYIAFHLVSLLEQMRAAPDPVPPLRALILGCTHYPFYKGTFRAVLARLYDYQENGGYPYRPLLAQKVALIDPAEGTARELYRHLVRARLLNRSQLERSEFYISVPNRALPGIRLGGDGELTYRYKYGRTAGQIQQYVKRVPFSRRSLSADAIQRIERKTPRAYSLIRAFNRQSPKARHLGDGERI
jgi:glutamate racemase